MPVRRLVAIPGFSIDRVAAPAGDNPEVLRLENLDTDVLPPAVALEATRQAVGRDEANSYLPFTGSSDLCLAVTDHLNRQTGNSYDPAGEALITCGGTEGMFDALLTITEPGDEVILTDPTYAGTIDRGRLAGAVPRLVVSINKGRKLSSMREDGVVPLAMELITFYSEGRHLVVRDLDARRVGGRIEIALDGQAGGSGGRGDQVEDDRVTDQRFAAPVLTDERKEAMLDPVPLAGTGREVTDRDRQPRLVGQPLQLPLPQAHPRAIAAATISGDQHPLGVGIASLSGLLPPAADALHRKGRRIVIDPHIDPARVLAQVIDAVGVDAVRTGTLKGVFME